MFKRIVVLLFFVQVSFGQTKDGVELCLEYQKIVSGFTSEKEANEALDKILNVIGASKNFTLIPCDNINNALAITFKSERYILFDSEFMNQITELTNDWSSIFILAHEVGHHINGHTREALLVSVLDDITLEKKREEELEADEFASFVLAKLGASLDDIKAGIELIATNDDDTYSTHPSQDKRLAAIKKGYDKAQSSIVIINKDNKQNNKTNNFNTEVIVNSNWRFKNRSAVSENHPQAIIYNDVITFANERGKPLDPFQIREYKDIYPLEYKQTIATAKTLDNIKNLEFNLSFTQKKWNSIKGRLPASPWSTITKTQQELLPFTELIIEIKNFQEQPKIQLDFSDSNYYNDKSSLIDSTNYKIVYRKDFKKHTKYVKFYYIIDDNIDGYFIAPLKGWKGGITKEFSNIKIIKDNYPQQPSPVDIQLWPPEIITYLNPEKEREYVTNLIKFLNGIKKGNKLYIKMSNEYVLWEDGDEDPWTNKFWTTDYSLNNNNTTYIIDLKGSSKALSF